MSTFAKDEHTSAPARNYICIEGRWSDSIESSTKPPTDTTITTSIMIRHEIVALHAGSKRHGATSSGKAEAGVGRASCIVGSSYVV
jgi:hypothetical protein